MDLSIIIVNWNSSDYVRNCLASIYANTTGLDFEVVVVDSGSFDGCEKMMQQQFPAARFVQSQENIGFARSNNLAFRHTAGDYVLFLNPDTEVVGPAIRLLWEQARQLPRAGAVGCQLLNSDRSLQTSCIQSFPTVMNQAFDSEILRKLFPKSAWWGIAPLYSNTATPQPAEAISGACILMKRAVFADVGQFSTDYFMYAEDIDLCYKTRQKNYTNFYVATANIVHHGDGSVRQAKTNFATVMAVESLSRFFRKYHGGFYARAYRTAMLLTAIGRLSVLGVVKFARSLRTGPAGAGHAAGKWRAIFRWAVGKENWALNYR